MHVLWRGDTLQRLRLVTGLILFAFAGTHFINHALGLISIDMMQAVQQYLKAVGVTTNIEIVEWARYLELVRQPPAETPMEIWLDGFNGSTAAGLLNQRWNCNAFAPTGQNVHGFCDNGVDQLLATAGRTLDDKKRDDLVAQAQQLISKDAPSIWGLASTETTGMSSKLNNPLIYKSELVTVDEHTWLQA